MTKDAELHIARCDCCNHFKSKTEKAVMGNIQATHTLQLVHWDFLTIKVTDGGKDVHILVIIDDFTVHASSGNIVADC